MSELKVNSIKGLSATSAAISIDNSSGTCTANITNNLSNRNLVINGAMEVAQRGTSSTTSSDYVVDRFRFYYGNTDAALTFAQADVTSGTTPYSLGFRKCLKLTNGNQTSGAAAGSNAFIFQPIEAQNIAKSGWNYTSSSSNITLSFWVKSSVAQNFYGYLRSFDGTGQLNAFETGSLTADTWTKVTKTISGNSNLQFDNDNNVGLRVVFVPFFGTDFTNNSATLNQWGTTDGAARFPDMTSTWYTTDGATFEVTGVQLEVSDYATSFEFLSFADELRRCQRYFHTGAVFTANDTWFHGYYGGGFGERFYPLPVTLRAAPTITFNSHSQVQVYENSGWLNRTISAKTSNVDRLLLRVNSTSHNYGKLLRLSGGSTYPIYYASAEL